MVYDSIFFLYASGNENVFTFARAVIVFIYSIILFNILLAILIFPFLHFSPFLMTFFLLVLCYTLHFSQWLTITQETIKKA